MLDQQHQHPNTQFNPNTTRHVAKPLIITQTLILPEAYYLNSVEPSGGFIIVI